MKLAANLKETTLVLTANRVRADAPDMIAIAENGAELANHI